jgi:hypothetical protein
VPLNQQRSGKDDPVAVIVTEFIIKNSKKSWSESILCKKEYESTQTDG